MTETEELRCMLDERGVEYEAPHSGFTIVRTDNAVCKFYETLEEPERGVFAVVTTDWLTPEQAIAATLGRGTLTADDVRDLIERHSDASGGNGRDFHNGAYVAIADELNATLGSCNCSNNCTNSERTTTVDETWHVGFHMWNGERVTIHVMECSKCGRTYEHVNGNYEFCPNCGRKLVTE